MQKKRISGQCFWNKTLLLNCTLIYLPHTYKKLISYIIALVHLILYYLTYFSLFSFHLAVLVRYKTSVMFIIGNLQIVRFGSSVYPQFVLLHGLLANNSYSHHPYVTFFHCEKALLVSSQLTSVFPILDSSRLLAVVWFWSRGGPWGYKYSFCCALSWMFFSQSRYDIQQQYQPSGFSKPCRSVSFRGIGAYLWPVTYW